MEAPFALLKLIAKASLNAVGFGIAGELIVEVLPAIAKDVWAWWSKDVSEAERRAAVEGVAALAGPEMKKAVSQVVAEVAGGKPPEVRARLANYMMMVQGSVRASLKRPEDPRGTTVPPDFSLKKAEDLLTFLPPRVPRFSPGDRPLPNVDRELVKLLGVGGFGEVWRARNPHLPSLPDVALKFCLDPTAKELLLKHEAGVLARVQRQGKHPGIVPLLHSYLSADPPCLEYELIEGGDLVASIYAHQTAKGLLEPVTASRIVLKLARAAGHLHKLTPPIVHRDLKPANVLVRRKENSSEFLITDFGIGGVVATQALDQANAASTSHPMLTAVRGAHTPLYASPEQKRGAPPDPRDDVHALGVIWYQLLVGDFSYGSPSGGAWRRGLVQRGLSEALLHLLESCLEGQAEHRPANAAVLAEDLKTLIERGSPRPPWEEDAKAAVDVSRTTANTRPFLEKRGASNLEVWKAAAEQGMPQAQWLYACCLLEGIGVAKDEQAAVSLLWKVADSGLAEAVNELGDCYCDGIGVEKDQTRAIELYTKAANLGFGEARVNLGLCYENGEGVAEDPVEAVRWYTTAAEQGWVEAQDYLGDAYLNGDGVAQDHGEAVKWYRKAAETGYPLAQVGLGSCYSWGNGVEENQEEAALWFKKAADQGEAIGLNALGNCHFHGLGVEQDYPQAIDCYRKAANQGLSAAQINLGNCYDAGKGVKKDLAKAFEWYRKAAELGDDDAQLILGNCYAKGKGIDRNRDLAIEWFRKATEQGNTKAKKALERIDKGSGGGPVEDDVTTDVMTAFRQVARGRGWQERMDLFRAVSQQMGYQRLSPQFRETLDGLLPMAIQRKILIADGDQLRAGTTGMDNYDSEDFREAMRAVMRPGERYERDEVIQTLTRHFGFVRVGETAQQAVRSAITGAIRRGMLVYEGDLIWRVETPPKADTPPEVDATLNVEGTTNTAVPIPDPTQLEG